MSRVKGQAIVLVGLFFVGALSSCHRVSGNQINFAYSPLVLSAEGSMESGYGRIFHLDYAKKEFSVTNDGRYGRAFPAVSGGTAPRYLLSVDEACKGVEDDLLDLAIAGNDRSVIYTEGYLLDGFVYGICNVYKDTVGYFSGGDNYGVEEISHAVYYRYDVGRDEFTVISKLDGVMAVAFSGENVVYWKQEKLYAFHIPSGEEKFICEDKSYDRGLRHQSRGEVYFNDEYALFYFAKAKGANENYFLYLFSFDTMETIEFAYRE